PRASTRIRATRSSTRSRARHPTTGERSRTYPAAPGERDGLSDDGQPCDKAPPADKIGVETVSRDAHGGVTALPLPVGQGENAVEPEQQAQHEQRYSCQPAHQVVRSICHEAPPHTLTGWSARSSAFIWTRRASGSPSSLAATGS